MEGVFALFVTLVGDALALPWVTWCFPEGRLVPTDFARPFCMTLIAGDGRLECLSGGRSVSPSALIHTLLC